MTQSFVLLNKVITREKIVLYTQNNRIKTMDKVTMYRATRTITYRDKSCIINEVSDEAFFTSKCKAVDYLRMDAEGIPEAVKRYERYRAGNAPCFVDYCVAVSEYNEFEGALVLGDTKVYVELRDGKLEDNRNDSYFETF